MKKFIGKLKKFTAMLLVFTMVMSGNVPVLADSLPDWLPQETAAVTSSDAAKQETAPETAILTEPSGKIPGEELPGDDEYTVTGYRSIDYTPDRSSYAKDQGKGTAKSTDGINRLGWGEVVTPSSYSSLDLGNVSTINNQGTNENCWAFAYTQAAETEIMTSGEETDAKFSALATSYFFYHVPEDPLGLVGAGTGNVIQQKGKNYLSFGGNALLTSMTMSAWVGVFDETEYPWSTASPTGKYTFKNDKLAAVQVGSYNISKDDKAGIKHAIMTYGSVEMACWASGLQNADAYGVHYAYIRTVESNDGTITDCFAYCPKSDKKHPTNHAVQIIGWDDTIPAEAFEASDESKPKHDGGWLVRNSWGSSFPSSTASHAGCFWISYEDATIDNLMVALDMEPAGTYLNNYHYDANGSHNLTIPTKQVLNVFVAQHTEEISAINVGIQQTTSAANPESMYTLQIYESEQALSFTTGFTVKPDREQTFAVHYSGLQFVELEEPLVVEKGHYFYVLVSSSAEASYFVEANDSIWDNTLYYKSVQRKGESFYWYEGSGKFLDSANQAFAARIKAFTKKIAGNLSVTVSDDNKVAEGEDFKILVTGDYTDEDMEYTYSSSPTGTFTSAKPTTPGTWYLKAVAHENKWQLGTEVLREFKIIEVYKITWVLNNGSPNEEVMMLKGDIPTHADPVKPNTAEWKYSFSCWNPKPVAVTGNATYEAQYVKSKRTYVVQWMNDDGTVCLERDGAVEYGATPSYDGATPTKTATKQYSYVFTGWSPKVSTVVADVKYYAQFTPVPRTYSVTWKDGDTTLLVQTGYSYQDQASYTRDDPTKKNPTRAATRQYVYTFAGWSLIPETADPSPKTVVNPIVVENDTICFAKFKKEIRKYTVTWKNADGTTLKTDKVGYGSTPSYSGAMPTKKSTATQDFVFTGWSPALVPVSGDAEYQAQFSAVTRKYTVTWKNYDGSVLQTNQVEYGVTPTFSGDAPAKPATAAKQYFFTGWSPEVVKVTKNATYTAQYVEVTRRYTVTWKNYDGTVLETDTSVAYGAMPEYNGATPQKPPTAALVFTFAGWSPRVSAVTGNVTYKATYKKTTRTYRVTWQNIEGSVLEVDEAVPYGKMPKYNGKTPKREPDAKYNYFFSGWTPKVTKVTGDAVYTAEYTAKKKGSGGGSGGGGGGGGGGAAVAVKTGPTYSRYWFVDEKGIWRIKTPAGQIITSAWLCDDAVAANGSNVWYLLNTDGTMLAAGLVQDNTGNYYSLEMNHNGYYGMLRYLNGTYDGIYMEFSNKHDGTFGAITNQSAIDALKAKYGVTRFGIGNDSCVYTRTFE